MEMELEVIAEVEIKVGRKTKIVSGIFKKIFDLNSIELEQFIDSKKGIIINKYSGIISQEKYYKINLPYEELKHIKLNRTSPILGLYQHTNAYKKKNKNR